MITQASLWDTTEEQPHALTYGDIFELKFECAGTKWQPEELAMDFAKHSVYPLAIMRWDWRNFNARILSTRIEVSFDVIRFAF